METRCRLIQHVLFKLAPLWHKGAARDACASGTGLAWHLAPCIVLQDLRPSTIWDKSLELDGTVRLIQYLQKVSHA